MTWLELINEIGHADLIRQYLQGHISKLELSSEIGNSNIDLVIRYQNKSR